MEKILKQIHQMEDLYVRLFSEAEEDEEKIIYVDRLIEDMYSHNFRYYKNVDVMKKELQILVKELQDEYLRVIFPGDAKKEYYEELSLKPTVNEYEIYLIESEKYIDLPINERVAVLKVTNDEILKDAVEADIEANKKAMGIEFVARRILRKSICYMDQKKSIDFYVAYDQGVPVGTVEYAYHENIVKIEDFDVLESHQKKGIGTSMLRQMLKDAYESNIEYAYLITDKSDTAKEMYQKCGFRKVDEKSELFFSKKST
ncbi:MAG: GNAT family N-acetyltransferase [Candidatus Izemoplasmataceae bacterium]